MKRIVSIFIAILLITVAFFLDSKYNILKKPEDNTILYDVVPEAKRTIYGNQSATANWALSLNEVDYVVSESDYILRVRILEKKDGLFKVDDPFPVSPIKVQVLETLKGNNVPEVIDISQRGGYVTIRQVMESTTKERIQKMGLDKVSEKEIDELYIYYEFDNYQNLELGETYIVLLKGDNFSLFGNGFTIFKPTNKKYANTINGITYENAITKETLVIPNIKSN